MAALRTNSRRRVRKVHPDVLRAIHQDLLTGASAPDVVEALSQRQLRGELPDHAIPSARTVSNIAREMRTDDSGEWTMNDAEPATVNLVLRILQAVVQSTEGRIASLTKRQARLLPVIHAAVEGRFTLYQTYLWARFYIAWVRTEQDARDVALAFATMTGGKWPITELSDGPRGLWPALTLPAVERVLNAAEGWLLPEMLEVQS
ncbi:MAG: hypothetical protein H0W81_04745 [Chloroflexi bacterium]|nr:hypothetical protein [Chloroflexota bacterium]